MILTLANYLPTLPCEFSVPLEQDSFMLIDPNSKSLKDSQPEPKQPEKANGEEKPVNPNELSEEEQMALYEEDHKDSDWGHQPC